MYWIIFFFNGKLNLVWNSTRIVRSVVVLQFIQSMISCFFELMILDTDAFLICIYFFRYVYQLIKLFFVVLLLFFSSVYRSYTVPDYQFSFKIIIVIFMLCIVYLLYCYVSKLQEENIHHQSYPCRSMCGIK